MSKKIVVLSDGTGNAAANLWRTNVWRTFESLDLTESTQVAAYDDGVGTSSFKPMAIVGGALCSTRQYFALLDDAGSAGLRTAVQEPTEG